MRANAPEIPHDPDYDRAYYAAYGIDPDEVMPKPEKPRARRRPRIYGHGTFNEAFTLGEGCAVIVEDAAGPYPTVYEYEHVTAPRWTLRQIYPMPAGDVYQWARERGMVPMSIAQGTDLEGLRGYDIDHKDLSKYYTEDQRPPLKGEFKPAYRPELKQESVLRPATFDAPEEHEEPKPERKRRGGLLGFLGISFEI